MVTVNLLDIAPEPLLVELVECCTESKWAMGNKQVFPCYLFISFTLTPSSSVIKDRFIAAFRALSGFLGTTTPASSLRAWINTALIT